MIGAMPPALTSLSHGAGCGCKLSAAALRPIVAGLPRAMYPRVLVATDTADDALRLLEARGIGDDLHGGLDLGL